MAAVSTLFDDIRTRTITASVSVTGGNFILPNNLYLEQYDDLGTLRNLLGTDAAGTVHLSGYHGSAMLTGIDGQTSISSSGSGNAGVTVADGGFATSSLPSTVYTAVSQLAIFGPNNSQLQITGTNLAAGIDISCNPSGAQSYIRFEKGLTETWRLGKQTDDSFFLFDTVGTHTVLSGITGATGTLSIYPNADGVVTVQSGPALSQDTGRFGVQGIRAQSTSGTGTEFTAMPPVGVALGTGYAGLRLYNYADNGNTGAIELLVQGSTAQLVSEHFGTGTAPTAFEFNGINVGIGIVPSTPLDVNGAATFRAATILTDGTNTVQSNLESGTLVFRNISSGVIDQWYFAFLNPSTPASAQTVEMFGGTGNTSAAQFILEKGSINVVSGNISLAGSLSLDTTPLNVNANIYLNGAPGAQGNILFADGGITKWYFGKNNDNTFRLYDAVLGTLRIVATSGGVVHFENGGVQLDGTLVDGTGAAGSSGQVLSSTGTSTLWIASSGSAASVDLTAQSASIGTTTLYAVPASNGQYLLTWNSKVTTVDSTSFQIGSMTITYTDPDGVVQTITAIGQNFSGSISGSETGNTTNTLLLGYPLLLNCKASTNIQYAFFVSTGTGNGRYNLHIKLESL